MIGEFPGLATGSTSDGNLRATSDFRGALRALLEQWLGADAAAIIPARSARSRGRSSFDDRDRLVLLHRSPAPARLQVGARGVPLLALAPDDQGRPGDRELVNYGEDAHDLRLRRVGGTRTYRIGKVRPGGLGELEARLLPGRFTLWCSLADHRKRGMSATLVVRKP